MRRYLIRLCLFIIVLICYNIIYAQQAKKKVACVGDSITEGWDLDFNTKAYPAILQHLLGDNYTVTNYGNIGKTLLKLEGDGDSYWKTDQYEDALDDKPDIVIIKLGTNDSKPDYWPEYKNKFYEDYLDFIKSFKDLDSKPKIYICLPVPVFEDKKNFDIGWGITEVVVRKEIIPLIKKAAQHMKCDTINMYAAFYGKDNSTTSENGQLMSLDGVHPTSLGAALIAEEVFKAITK